MDWMQISNCAVDLDRLSYKRVVFRSDNEFVILAFLNELRRHWQGEVIPEAPWTGDPQSNGAAERGVRMIKGATRTIKDALEYNLAQGAPALETSAADPPTVFPTNALMTSMVKYAGACQ